MSQRFVLKEECRPRTDRWISGTDLRFSISATDLCRNTLREYGPTTSAAVQTPKSGVRLMVSTRQQGQAGDEVDGPGWERYSARL